MINSQPHHYTDGHDTFIGRLVWDDADTSSKPGVLVAPAFGGLGPFELERANELAEAGFAVLAVDYYGDGKRASDNDEALSLMGYLNANRDVFARRMVAALHELQRQKIVDEDHIGAMGYCLGGKAVLDLARTGENFQAAVSLHGVFDAPAEKDTKMVPSVLVLHGWDDPLAKPDAFNALATELTSKCDDWQMFAFGHTSHSFTNPNAQAPEAGIAYSQRAATRSWKALIDFFDETLRK